LGDLDVAVKYRDRILKDPNRAETTLAYAHQSGRSFNTFVDQLVWPDTELRQILKAKKRTIRILDWGQFVTMAVQDSDRIPYKVVFGSTEEVAAEILAKS
jgi:hypothetical protein